MQYRNPVNRRLVIEGLIRAGRTDLIGDGEQYLIPASEKGPHKYASKQSRNKKIT
jgi:hypothetical protein